MSPIKKAKKPVAVQAKPAVTAQAKPAAKAQVKTGPFGRPIVEGAKRKAPARAKAPKLEFKAPDGFKSCFVTVKFSTAKDGFLSTKPLEVKMIRGRFDSESAVEFDLMEADPDTAFNLTSRILMLTFAPNPIRRLAPGTTYELLVRASVSRDGIIRAGVKTIWRGKKNDLFEIEDKTDPELRKLRRSGRFLAAAFTNSIGTDELYQGVKEQARVDREEAREQAKLDKIEAREQAKLDRQAERTPKASTDAKARARR